MREYFLGEMNRHKNVIELQRANITYKLTEKCCKKVINS